MTSAAGMGKVRAIVQTSSKPSPDNKNKDYKSLSPFIPKHELRRSALHVVAKDKVRLATGDTPKRPIRRVSRSKGDSTPSLATAFAGTTPNPAEQTRPTTARRVQVEPKCNTELAGRTPKRPRLFDMPLENDTRTPNVQHSKDPFLFDTLGDKETEAIERWLNGTSPRLLPQNDSPAPPVLQSSKPVPQRTTPKRNASAAAANRVHTLLDSYRKQRRAIEVKNAPATTPTATLPPPPSTNVEKCQHSSSRRASDRRPDIQTSRMVHPSVVTRQSKAKVASTANTVAKTATTSATRARSTRTVTPNALLDEPVVIKKEEPLTPRRYTGLSRR
ncbi:hypothetical protein BDF19DRAFT_455514 [Syncephalis fuscata]|nr:hypothetical protein BDF19DRAFT_455514 [Syncephalis fuscata]